MTFHEIKTRAKEEIRNKGQVRKCWHMSADVYGNLRDNKCITYNEERVMMYKGIPVTTIPEMEDYIELKERTA